METQRPERRRRRVAGDASRLPAADLARRIGRIALEQRAEDVVLLDLRGISAACDFFVIATGFSEPHLSAIADEIEETLAGEGVRPWHVEGRQNRKWVLLDFVDVVAHLFLRDTREYYRLENLWGEAPRESLEPRGPDAEAHPQEDS